MAEQYSSFQGKEPNIDINLYPNAMNQGIAAGNAQKSVVSSVIQGGIEGVKTGMGIVQGFQQIQSNANALAVSSDPQVQQAEKDTRIAAGAQAALKTEILTQNKALAIEAEVAALTRQKEENNLKLSDINGEKAIGSALNTIGSLASPDEQRDLANQILMSNNGLFSRNTQLAYQTMQQMKPYASPEVYKQTFDGVSAIQQQKLMQARMADEENRKAVYAQKTEEKFTDAINTLRGQGTLRNIPVEDLNLDAVDIYDASTVDLEPDGTLKVDPRTKMPVKHAPVDPAQQGKSYYVAHYNEIASTLDDKRYVDVSKAIETAKIGAAARPEWGSNTRKQAQPGNPADINTDRAGLAAGLPLPGTPSTGTTPADKAAARYQALGANPTFESLRQQSAARVRNSAVTRSNDLTLPTDTPIPANVQPLVSPTPVQADPVVAGKNFSSLEFNQSHLKNVLGGADVTINIPFGNPTLSKKTFEAVNSIDALKNQSALSKAVVLTESGGRVDAVNRDAVGAMQMRPAAAQDTGLALEDRTNPDRAIPAGIEYINQIAARVEKGMNDAEKLLTTELANTLPIKPDPRMTLSAYNGGGQDVLRAIRSGAKTWDRVDAYLKLNKSPAAYKENTDYVNRVISASIPFLTGGNASDNAYVNALNDANIITITPPDER
jgi:hypothetical protein